MSAIKRPLQRPRPLEVGRHLVTCMINWSSTKGAKSMIGGCGEDDRFIVVSQYATDEANVYKSSTNGYKDN